MPPLLLLGTFLFFTATIAKPNGYYRQEYGYKASSASYRNNELQHRNDDEGFYSKDGDLEGRLRPRVNSHNQHSEYINPKLQHYQIGDGSTSYGQLHAPPDHFTPEIGAGQAYGYMGGTHQMVGAHHAVNNNLRQITAGIQEEMARELQRAVFEHHRRSSAYTNTISQSQIEADMRALEEEMKRNVTLRLEEALKTHYGNQGIRGGYSYTIMNGRLQPMANYNQQELAELTRQMEANLMRELEQQMQTYYHTTVNTEVHNQRNTYRKVNGNYPSPLQQRPPMFVPQPHPLPPQPHPQPIHIPVHMPDSITTVATRVQTELNEHLNKILEDTQRRYFAENSYHNLNNYNFDQILAQLQEDLRANITLHLDEQIKRTYGFTNYASKYSVEDIENLRRQIEHNLLTKLNRDFNRQREKFYQTHGGVVPMFEPRPMPTNPIPTNPIPVNPIPVNPMPANHVFYPNNMQHQADMANIQRELQETMSRQIQTALMQHSYRQAHSYAGGANFNPQEHYQATLEQLTAELNRNLTRQMEQFYSARNYQESGAYQAQLASMRNQLQHDLMRQLQQGLQQSYSRYSSWSSSSSSSSSSNHNYRPVRGFDPNLYRSYGSTGDVTVMGDDCMMGDDPSAYQQQDDTDSKLQNDQEVVDYDYDGDLQQKVEPAENLSQQTENLTQQVKSHDDLTQQTEDLTQQTEDLTQQTQTHDDLTQQTVEEPGLKPLAQREDLTLTKPSTSHSYDYKPQQDLTQQTQTKLDQAEDLTKPVSFPTYHHKPETEYRRRHYQNLYEPYHGRYHPRYTSTYTWQPQSGLVRQRVDQYEGIGRGGYRQHIPSWRQSLLQKPVPLGQQTEDWSLSQPTQNWRQPQVNNQYQKPVGDPLGQQVEDFGRPQVSTQYRPSVQNQRFPGQQTEDLDLTQQTQTLGKPLSTSQYQQIPIHQQNQHLLGQQTQDLDLTQQTQTLGKPLSTDRYQKQSLGQQTEDLDLTQQTQNWEPQTNNQYRPTVQNQQLLGQQTEDLGLTQQIQPVRKPLSSSQYQQIPIQRQNQPLLGQQTEDLDLTQQVVQPFSSNQFQEQNQPILGQQTENFDTIQPVQPLSSSQYQLPVQKPAPEQNQQVLGQQTEDLGLTQQVQQPDFGKLQIPDQSQEDLNQQVQSPDFGQQTEDVSFGKLQQPQSQPVLLQQPQNQFEQPQYTGYGRYVTKPPKNLMNPVDLTQQTQDFDSFYQPQQNTGLNQQPQDIGRSYQPQPTSYYPNSYGRNIGQSYPLQKPQPQQNDYLIQQQTPTNQFGQVQPQNQPIVEPLSQQTQQVDDFDLTQQTQEEDFTKLSQQDLTQQVEDFQQPVEPQIASNKFSQQTQDLIQQEINQNQQSQIERENQQLIELLRNKPKDNQETQSIGTTDYKPQTVYGTHGNSPYDRRFVIPPPAPYEPSSSTTKSPLTSNYGAKGRSLLNQKPTEVNYATEEEEEEKSTESVRDIEPVEPQVADEVVVVDGVKGTKPVEVPPVKPVEPTEKNETTPKSESESNESDSDEIVTTTTKKPGFWSRIGTSIKNKANEYKEKIG